MGFLETEDGCKIHPFHHQKQGVCPSCLRERLSGLCSTSYDEASRLSPYYYYCSPSADALLHHRSRSIACVPKKVDDEEKGFWSKLLGLKGKKDIVMHSNSMRL
ncbi:hypothetical protein ES332_D12G097900v1 [Gossypium tomentosum]|uniref:Uncharacterized protein n=1 Tax=Gossypium tomentosum TaxID=34277 RepID=A0A5D2I738_GOSTO|nr:hypothetical protein ES332_D12G097900v1 [Gossypium tomentosum]